LKSEENTKSPKAFEEGKRAAWISIWTLLGIGIAEVVVSTTTSSLTLKMGKNLTEVVAYFGLHRMER